MDLIFRQEGNSHVATDLTFKQGGNSYMVWTYLEFDSVIIEAYSVNYLKYELHAKLLYVAMPRALHYLHVFYCEEKTSMLC